MQRLDLPRPCAFEQTDDVVEVILRQIEEHPNARLIAVFDLLEHAWESGTAIPSDIRAIKQVLFCFGEPIAEPELVAMRPRAITVTETDDRFIVNCVESPIPESNATLARWLSVLAEESQ